MDEWNRDKMSEPPPVYNLMIFPVRRDTANHKNTKTHRLFPLQRAGMYCSLCDDSKPCLFVFNEKIVVRSVHTKKRLHPSACPPRVRVGQSAM